ncbi:MAG: AbrB/MazE/SpoVT family DNA-binding domain-containing protein [Hadesarchaea archaeon]|nr:AbrB/MazE/SpoVT family DNA-binding domain-containing protein [Hadesarchaea archaeon]
MEIRRVDTKISSKGQLVIPKELREKYGIKAGTVVVFQEEEEGIKILSPIKLADLCGTFKIDVERAKRELEKERSEW